MGYMQVTEVARSHVGVAEQEANIVGIHRLHQIAFWPWLTFAPVVPVDSPQPRQSGESFVVPICPHLGQSDRQSSKWILDNLDDQLRNAIISEFE
ncbi:hypothetical protein AB0M34_12670 [Nocardia sp. NPDC050193]